MAIERGSLQLTFIDADGELTSTVFKSDDAVLSADLTQWDIDSDALQTAIEAVVIGNTARVRKAPYVQTYVENLQASSKWAQRERKWLVVFQDTITGDQYTLTIGTADISGAWYDADTEYLDLVSTEGAAFVAAFEAFARAPKTQNTVSVLSVKFVGRNT